MKLRSLCLCALFAALTAAGAFLRIPLGYTSATLQFFFTAMAGVLLGAKYGALSQLLYVLLGLAGLPVFTLGGGPGYVLQPGFGYLLGLIPAAWVIGKVTQKRRETRFLYAAMALGLLTLYAVGLPYLWLISAVFLDRDLTLTAVLTGGMLVYLPGDAVKIAAAAFLCGRIRDRLPIR